MTRSHGRRNDGQDSRGSCSGCLRLRRLLFLLLDELEQLLQKKNQKMSKNANYVAIADASGFPSTMSLLYCTFPFLVFNWSFDAGGQLLQNNLQVITY